MNCKANIYIHTSSSGRECCRSAKTFRSVVDGSTNIVLKRHRYAMQFCLAHAMER